jgi:predicted nucleotidyltransferase
MKKNMISETNKKGDLILRFGTKVTSVLREHVGNNAVSVCLFGSAARERLRKGSDIDFLVVFEDAPASYHKRVKLILPLIDKIRESEEYSQIEELGLQLEPSFLLLTAKEVASHPSILIDISQEGVILFDKGGFLNSHLSLIREKLVELGAVKKSTPHGHYWILKPDLLAGEALEL